MTTRFQEWKARLRYRLDDIFARSSLSQLVLLVLLSMVVVLIGMTAYFFGLFAPENEGVEGIGQQIDRGLLDSLWWSLKHLIDPGVFAENYGASLPVVLVSLLIAVMSMVIFGILIGFISTSMESRLAALQKGNSPVKETGHTLILGWSNKIASILELLARSREGLRVVVLGRPDIGEMQETMRSAGILSLPIKVILRSGSPSNILELKRVAFEHAKSIIVLAGWARDADASGRDVEAIKTAMLLSGYSAWPGPKPILVSEVNRKQNAEIARIAGRNEIFVVSSSEVISKIIVQATRQQGLSFVYSEVLSANGNSISVLEEQRCTGKRFGDVLYGFKDAIPIGVSWRQEDRGAVRFAAGLNPEPDYLIDADDRLVLLSRGRARFDPAAKAFVSSIECSEQHDKKPLSRILVLGFNDNVHGILSEFDGHLMPGSRVHVVSNFHEAEINDRMDRYATRTFRNIDAGFSRGDTVSAGFLRSLDVPSYDAVITLADESNDDDPDARSIMLLLLLTDIMDAAAARRVHVVSELHDPRNRDLVGRTVAREIIVSPEILSMQLSQISQQPVLDCIYRELLSAGGTEICLKPASRYAQLDTPCSFNDLQYSAQKKMEVALGVRIADAETGAAPAVQLNPDRSATWRFRPEDDIIVLAQEIYD
jgi:hypothetical protein